MKPLFSVQCSAELAAALGAKPPVRVARPDCRFPVYAGVETAHAQFQTEAGPFAWLWQLDRLHPFIVITDNPWIDRL